MRQKEAGLFRREEDKEENLNKDIALYGIKGAFQQESYLFLFPNQQVSEQ